MHRLIALLTLCILASSSSCTNGAVALCEERARLQCELAFACCSPEERFGLGTLYVDDEAECAERVSSTCSARESVVDESIALGRTAFDDVRAEECLTALRAAAEGCDPGAAQRAQLVCDDVTAGAVGDGGECAFSRECRAGGTCDLESPPDVDDALHAPLGTCVEPPSQGDECPEGVCATGLFCQNNRCDVLPGEGDPCNLECAPGLYCADTEFTCEAQKVDGEPCANTEECLAGACELGPDDDQPRCSGSALGECSG